VTSGINWYEETVSGQDTVVPNQPPTPTPQAESGISWYQETVSTDTPIAEDQPVSEQTEEPRLTVETQFPENEQGIFQSTFDRNVENLKSRGFEIMKTVVDSMSGNITPGERSLRIAGDVAGAYFDSLGEGFGALGAGISEVAPDKLKEITGKALDASKTAFLGTELGQAGLQAAFAGVEAYKQFKEQHPRAAKNLESATNVGLILAPPNIAGAKPTRLSKFGESVKAKSGAKKESWVKDLVLPEQTKAVKEAETVRTIVSPITQKKSVIPTDREAAMISEVAKVPGIKKPGVINTIQNSINKTREHLTKITNEFETKLAKTGVSVSQKDVTNRVVNSIQDSLHNGLFVVGEGKQVAKRLKRMAASIIESHSVDGRLTGTALLKARREIDARIKAESPKSFSTTTADTARKTLSRQTRDEMNEILDDNVRMIDPGFNTKIERNRQSLLLQAMENMAPKAANEAKDVIGRSWQHVARVTRLRSEVANVAAVLAGTTVLKALTDYSAMISTGLAVAGVTAIAGKVAMSRPVKMATVGLVGLMDEALEASVKAGNKAMVQQLRADRALLIEVLQNSEIVEEQDSFDGMTIEITKDATEQ